MSPSNQRREFNDRFLRSIKPPETGRVEYSDTLRKGLRLRVSAGKPGRMVWLFEKRIKGGLKRKNTIGTYPTIGLAEARDTALAIEAEAARGIDRVADRREAKIAEEAAKARQVTCAEVLAIYDRLHLSTLRTRSERNRQLQQALAPYLDKPIEDLSRKHLQRAIDAKTTNGRGAYANRIRAALMAFTRWATQRDYIQNDIGAALPKALKEAPRDRVLSMQEVRSIWKATFLMGAMWGPFFRLLILTGQRRGEVASLRWEEIDFKTSAFTKSGAVTKNGRPHTTHLSEPALRELTSFDGDKTGLLFSTTGSTPISGFGRAKARLDNLLGEDFQPWRLHDIRTALASALNEAGEAESVVDRILNHVASGSAPSTVSRVYNQSELLPQRARALDKWAALVLHEETQVLQLYGN